MIRDEQGSMSAFLAMLFLVFLLLISVCVEGIYMYTARGKAMGIYMSGLSHTKGNYQKELADMYHIYAMDPRYHKKIETDFSDRMKESLDQNGDPFRFQTGSTKISDILDLSAQKGEVLKYQIRQQMQYEAAGDILKNLTKKIEAISKKLTKTNVEYLDTPIDYSENDEIKPLVESYNSMLGKLQEQTNQLAKTEREEAWREMARQVAHEINNPLTPLKLSVQNFQRKYNPDDPENEEKIRNLTQVVVHQIDIIYSIAKSFSDFAKMPTSNDTLIDVVKTIKYSVDIFPDHIIEFYTNVDELYYKIDGIYLTRIITNIVKNGIQSITHNNKKVRVEIKNKSDRFIISIEDNGSGISEENRDRVFEQKFTTKSTGMGLGLSMVKKIVEDYNGKIWFETEIDEGTTFYIEFLK